MKFVLSVLSALVLSPSLSHAAGCIPQSYDDVELSYVVEKRGAIRDFESVLNAMKAELGLKVQKSSGELKDVFMVSYDDSGNLILRVKVKTFHNESLRGLNNEALVQLITDWFGRNGISNMRVSVSRVATPC